MKENNKLIFNTRVMKITIDYDKCEPARTGDDDPSCGFACVRACRFYGRNILRIQNTRPVLSVSDPAEIERLDNECLSCEYNCETYGAGCIIIEIPME